MPVDRSPEARSLAVKQCAEIDQMYDQILGPEGRQKMAEIHEQDRKFIRQDKFIDRKRIQRQLRKETPS